jgi:hypothetical protein
MKIDADADWASKETLNFHGNPKPTTLFSEAPH